MDSSAAPLAYTKSRSQAELGTHFGENGSYEEGAADRRWPARGSIIPFFLFFCKDIMGESLKYRQMPISL